MTGTQDYDAEVVACATDAIVANANGEHLDEALEVLDYIGVEWEDVPAEQMQLPFTRDINV